MPNLQVDPTQVTEEAALAAHAAMETYEAWRRHTRHCQQCRVGPEFCQTRTAYEQAFEKDYQTWRRL